MPNYDLHAAVGGGQAHLDTFDASDVSDAIALSIIRLERQDVELKCDGVPVARISKNGRITRLDSTSSIAAGNSRGSRGFPSPDQPRP